MLSVYLRYLYMYQGKKYTVSFATGYKLKLQQILLLKANKLGDKTQEELKKQESGLINIVKVLNVRDNGYPDKSTLLEYFDKTVNVLTIEKYLNSFLQQLRCKQSSEDIYEITHRTDVHPMFSWLFIPVCQNLLDIAFQLS